MLRYLVGFDTNINAVVDGKTAGVIIFLWLLIMLAFYPILKV
jgi:hypothetical protein